MFISENKFKDKKVPIRLLNNCKTTKQKSRKQFLTLKTAKNTLSDGQNVRKKYDFEVIFVHLLD